MGHRNARLTFHGRRLLVQRVCEQHLPVAHVAKAMGVSRQCAHRWLTRFEAEGEAGLWDRSSRPHRMPTKTSAEVEAVVVAARLESRRGPDWLAAELGVAARTVSRILRRHQVPRLAVCDPMTGEVIRASKTTALRYERAQPGELCHMDVKKIGRIPDGGGWRAHGRQIGKSSAQKKARIGFDYIHSLIDDHSRFAYSEILTDEKASTCTEFLARAVQHFAAHRHHSHPGGHDRQPLELHPQRLPAGVVDPDQGHPPADQAALPLAEREGRAVQPKPPKRMGLSAGLHHQHRPQRRSWPLARALQQSTTTQRTRGPSPHQPPVTNLMTEYT